MNHPLPLLLGISASMLLCHCSAPEEKESSTKEMSLAQRTMQKPDTKVRSQFEKYITGSGSGMKTGAANWYQKQMHHSKGFNGGSAYAGQKAFKTGQSWFGKSKAPGMDMTYSMGGRQSSMASSSFKSGQSRFGSREAREGSSAFSGGNDVFGTRSALTRAKGTPEAPLIIENYEATSTKKSAYSEDEVKRLLGR
ncbi:MAG: hypothetical protein ACO1TE_15720 [Prosthecobacter sp.]